MKLRIFGDSIRLRLGKSEVRRLVSDGVVMESIRLGGKRLEYVLRADSEELGVSARFDGDRIVVRAPSEMVGEWASTERVGISAVQVASDGAAVKILIEKDFECINPPADESQEDAFPHPAIGAICPPTGTT